MNVHADAWRIGGVPVSWIEGNQPAPVRGESGTYELRLVADGRGDHVARYQAIMDWQVHAGEFDMYDTISGPPMFREQHEREPLLVAVEPASDDPTGRGLWGLVENVDDSTEVPQRKCFVSVDVLHLAPLGDYADKQAVRQALEADGPAP
ncbi:hypothetical protein [Halococcus sp. AFM35]|uniref:hypothetical protein n=1 Tax=Halococcus sp. AFM35 TaxID=3421653 RepID=UPI003EB6B443